ncbi:MAG: acyltransferase [Pseudomonadota bacterium]
MRDAARTADQSATPESPAPSAPHWASLNENTFVAGIKLLFWIYRVLGRTPFRLCLYPVVAYYWATKPLARQSSLEYLQRLHTHQRAQKLGSADSPEPGAWQSLQHLLAFADTILDKLLAMSGSLGGEALRSVGEEDLLALKDQGRGAIIVTGHVGCMELCRLSAERHRGVRLNVLVHTVHAERFNRLLQRLHPDSPVRLIQVTEISPATAIMLSEKVAQGEYVAIAGDRVPVSHTTTVPAHFLGAQARWPVGPYVLAALLKCPLYAMACVRENDPVHGHGYVLRVQHLADTVVLPRGRREEAMARHAQDFATWLETVLVRSPMAWFNFFPFWRQAEQPPVKPEQ